MQAKSQSFRLRFKPVPQSHQKAPEVIRNRQSIIRSAPEGVREASAGGTGRQSKAFHFQLTPFHISVYSSKCKVQKAKLQCKIKNLVFAVAAYLPAY
jgi:hypothetical protein